MVGEELFQTVYEIDREALLEQNDGTPRSKVLTALRLFALNDYYVENGHMMYHSSETFCYAIEDNKRLSGNSSNPNQTEVTNILEELVGEKIAEKVFTTVNFRPYHSKSKVDDLNPSKNAIPGYRLSQKS